MTYSYRYKKPSAWFWKCEKNLIGHQVKDGKMILFHENGNQSVIAHWDDYDAKLGSDWFLFTKHEMEKEAGVPIK